MWQTRVCFCLKCRVLKPDASVLSTYKVCHYYNVLNFLGGKLAFALHILSSLLNTMYIPYAIVYYIQRVYLMCQVNSACSISNLTLDNYMTPEIIVMLVGILANIPFWFFILMLADIKKNGGRVGDAFKILQVIHIYSQNLRLELSMQVATWVLSLYCFCLFESHESHPCI